MEECGYIVVIDWRGLLFSPIWRSMKKFAAEKNEEKKPKGSLHVLIRRAEGFWKRFHEAVTGD